MHEPAAHSLKEHDSKPHFVCRNCGTGRMLSVAEEGEPEYTDDFICQQCQHRDTIPSSAIILSQLVSGTMGAGISIYLLACYLSKLLSGFQYGRMQNTFEYSGLILAAFSFLIGFLYILLQAYQGISHRRQYSPDRPRETKK